MRLATGGHPATEAPHAGQGHHRGRLTLMVLLLIGMCAVYAVEMTDAYRQARGDAVRSTGNLATALAIDLSRNIDLLDLSIRAVVDGWSNDEVRALKPSLRDQVLFDRSASAQHFGPILVLDRYGSVAATSDHTAPLLDSYAARDDFKAHVDQDGLGLYVSKPFREADGGWTLAFSRRLNDSDGTFSGVVAGTLRLSYLRDAYGSMRVGDKGMIALFGAGGVMIARQPMPDNAIGKPAGLALIRNQEQGPESGSFEARSTVDDVERLFGFHRVGALPLFQYVALSTREVYADFWRRATIIGGVVGLLSVGMLVLLHSLKGEFETRVAAEEALASLASKDDLTGLLNRRAFNAVLDREWQSGMERDEPIGLLMIDADHFKAYNDAHGHPAGDAALKSIAAAISYVAQSRRGYPCRYGGEEFAVLLPATGTEAARAVAEEIRQSVHDLCHAHGGSARGRLTVSIGVSCRRPAEADRPSNLVSVADEQLYVAKLEGRNRTSLAA